MNKDKIKTLDSFLKNIKAFSKKSIRVKNFSIEDYEKDQMKVRLKERNENK